MGPCFEYCFLVTALLCLRFQLQSFDAVVPATSIRILAVVAYYPEIIVPAVDIALSEVTEIYPNLNFTITKYFSPNVTFCVDFESVLGAYVAHFFNQEIEPDEHLIILPTGCSDTMIIEGDFAREWNVPVIASAGTDSRLKNKMRFKTLVRLLPSQIVEYASSFLQLLIRFKWWTVTIICDPDSSVDPFFGQTCWNFQEALRIHSNLANKPIFTTYALTTNLSRVNLRQTALKEAQSRSRVIVILAHMDQVRDSLITATDMGMMGGDFAYISAIPYNYDTTLRGSLHWFRDNSISNKIAMDAFRFLLVITLAHPLRTPRLTKFLNTIKWTAQQIYYVPNAVTEETELIAISVHTTVKAIAEMVNETVVTGRNLSDGSQLTKNMYNRNFDSVAGQPFKVGNNGDRDALYTVLGVDNSSTELLEVLYYDASDKALYQSPFGKIWNRQNQVPQNLPPCGYSPCSSELAQRMAMNILLPVFVGITSILAVILLLYWYRRRLRAKIDPWRIDPAEIVRVTSTGSSKYSVPGTTTAGLKFYNPSISAASTRSLLAPAAVAHGDQSGSNGQLAKWKHEIVWCKKYSLLHQKLNLSKEQGKALSYRKRMEHPNIASFFGIAILPVDHFVLIIAEYTPKQSIQDLVDGEMIDLNLDLKYSFIDGLTSGLQWIHSSTLRLHGNLSATNCLIDQRLTLRLTDFGLESVTTQAKKMVTALPHEVPWRAQWKQLYFPPEVLQVPSGINIRASSDVYAFAIIVHQILFKCNPFYIENDFYLPNHEKDAQVIVENVKKLTDPPYRPPIPRDFANQSFVSLLSDCWADSPTVRPTLAEIRYRLDRIPGMQGQTSFIDSVINRLEKFAHELEEDVVKRTREYEVEKRKTDDLLYQIIPKSLVRKLHRGIAVPPELFEEATICFTAVTDFPLIVTYDPPMDVVSYLNDMFSMLDKILQRYKVYKVETIADSYMVVSGLPERNGHQHVSEICNMCLHIIAAAKTPMHRGIRFGLLQLKIGISTGPCAASIVGTKMPRYCLFGDSINTASRMTTFGAALQIHISESTADYVAKYIPDKKLRLTWRGTIPIKGKGEMDTYWLTSDEPMRNG